ncbi:hypothetical protein [Herbiconiux liangxiaofengii]|uniref:hypothetical protein n=1 Tax=Herbiconiux liangxiaofengii TaxID=3342795 RepID=UPI0035B8AA0F
MATGLERPARHTVLRSFAGHLDATPDAVFRALRAELAPAAPLVDEPARTLVVQGEWWYRAEYRVRTAAEHAGAAGPAGGHAATDTLIEHEIVNVAARWHRAAPIAGRAELREAPYAFQRLLTAVQTHLDSATPLA